MKILIDKEYFAYPAISKSQLHNFDPLNPIGFWEKCKLNPQCAPDGISDAMINGKLRHTLLLEPAKFEEQFLIIEDGRGYSSRTTQTFQKVIEANPNKDVILQSEYDNAKKAIDTLKSYPLIQSVLTGLTIEKSYLWTDSATGLPLKCKLDGIKNITEGLVITEYKTTSKMEQVLSGLDKAGWQWDAGMQTKAIKEKYKVEPFKMVFIIQSNQAGEEHKIAFRSINGDDCNTCEMFVDMALGNIKARLQGWKDGNPDAWKTRLIEEGFIGANGGSFSYNFDRYFEGLKA